MELAEQVCLRNWFYGFDTQLAHVPRCIFFTRVQTQDAIMWFKKQKCKVEMTPIVVSFELRSWFCGFDIQLGHLP